jgi:hypothetical protein
VGELFTARIRKVSGKESPKLARKFLGSVLSGFNLIKLLAKKDSSPSWVF